MGMSKLICKCGHKESEHLITSCDKCNGCERYSSVGFVTEEYVSLTGEGTIPKNCTDLKQPDDN
jgi:hypothetical protein